MNLSKLVAKENEHPANSLPDRRQKRAFAELIRGSLPVIMLRYLV
jgi:hypothetical protein